MSNFDNEPMTLQQIAELWGCTKKTVLMLERRALLKFKAHLWVLGIYKYSDISVNELSKITFKMEKDSDGI